MTFSATGLVGGTPTETGDFSVTVTVTDSAGGTAKATYELAITPSPPFTGNPFDYFNGVAYAPPLANEAYGYNNIILSGGIIGTGQGQTIALIEDSDQSTMVSSIPQLTLDRPDQVSYADSDLAAFSSDLGLPQFGSAVSSDAPVFVKLSVATSAGSIGPINTNYQISTGNNGEFLQDVQTIHDLAPQANIVVFIAPQDATDDQLAQIYQIAMSFPNNLQTVPDLTPAQIAILKTIPPVSVVSSSVYSAYNEYPDEVNQEPEYLPPYPETQPATVIVAAGDTGYFPPRLTGPQYPGNSANVISAAMTEPSIGADGQLISELGVSNAGGGPSLYLPEPSWQIGVVDDYSTTTRVAPDVGMIGSFTAGMSFIEDGRWLQANGSSNAAPAWAALMAIIDQGRALLGEQPLTTLQALPMLYALPASDFNKISQLDDGTDVPANFNDAAGLGSPVANALAAGMDGGQNTITGTVTNTLTGAGLAGWTVFLDANNDGVYQPGLDGETVTGANGTYSFLVAPGDDYRVRVQAPPGTGLVQISANPAAITFAPGGNATASGVDFVFAPSTVPITGMLDPVSDSGLSNDDGITNVTRPIFMGTTAPGAIVELFAQAVGSASNVMIGKATANSLGNWSITATTLADGRYAIQATAIEPATGVESTVELLPDSTEGYLTVDTQYATGCDVFGHAGSR